MTLGQPSRSPHLPRPAVAMSAWPRPVFHPPGAGHLFHPRTDLQDTSYRAREGTEVANATKVRRYETDAVPCPGSC
jgi:hypothetical protein